MIEHTDDPLIFNAAVNRQKYASHDLATDYCPFCHLEDLTDILARKEDMIWLKNKYPTIEKSLMTVLIESEEHLGDISTNAKEKNRAIFAFAFDCWTSLLDDSKYRSVLMFKNYGPRSGGTLRHPHMQIIALEEVDGYAEISTENFEGLEVVPGLVLSERPVMGFVEFNIEIEQRNEVDQLADLTGTVTHYLTTTFMDGRCDSYNLFFYKLGERLICKVVPRFVTSPYFIGYKIPQVQHRARLETIAKELRECL
ncbi:MAG: DUF4931 domain-containing protein [Streptococcaceae bacterium]|jgi:galactose-1-phosphate uridylyltransferase|nr:DUF4931 domain-containing protein [Streptococcaceae bacterium]